jgi:hypothetical protein
VKVTDTTGRRLGEYDDTTVRRRPEDDVIATAPMPIGSEWGDDDSYRDPGRWAKRLLPGATGPIWYFERRHGLISLYDDQTRTLRGWLGPDGYSEGSAMPAKRFAGELQAMDSTRARDGELVLVLSGGVYLLHNLSRPRLLFAPRDGEAVVAVRDGRVGKQIPRGVYPEERSDERAQDDKEGGLTVVSTTARTYVLDDSGRVEMSVRHPAGSSGRVVRVYRAPLAQGAPTFAWYSAGRAHPRDTLSDIVNFPGKSGAATIEHRLPAVPFAPAMNMDVMVSAAMQDAWTPMTVNFIPAYHFTSGKTGYFAPANRLRTASFTILFGLALVFFGFWLRRRGLSNGEIIAWTILAAVTGPIALVLLWMFRELPARDACGSCGRLRVVGSFECRDCGGAVRIPAANGTEVFAV